MSAFKLRIGFFKGNGKVAHNIPQTVFRRQNAVQSSLLIFDDAIWHCDQNRLDPVCIVRPKAELL